MYWSMRDVVIGNVLSNVFDLTKDCRLLRFIQVVRQLVRKLKHLILLMFDVDILFCEYVQGYFKHDF